MDYSIGSVDDYLDKYSPYTDLSTLTVCNKPPKVGDYCSCDGVEYYERVVEVDEINRCIWFGVVILTDEGVVKDKDGSFNYNPCRKYERLPVTPLGQKPLLDKYWVPFTKIRFCYSKWSSSSTYIEQQLPAKQLSYILNKHNPYKRF